MSERLPPGYSRVHKTTLLATLVVAIGGVALLLPASWYAAPPSGLYRAPAEGPVALERPGRGDVAGAGKPAADARGGSATPGSDGDRRARPVNRAERKEPTPAGPADAGGRSAHGALLGTVRDARGAPLADVPVHAISQTARNAGAERGEHHPSAADGTFRLRVRPGSWRVQAGRVGATVVSRTLEVSPGIELKVSLPPLPRQPRPWRLLLRDARGRALVLPRARAVLSCEGHTVSSRRSALAKSGTLQLDRPPIKSGQANLRVDPGDARYRVWEGEVAVPRPGGELRVTLTRAPVLEATLVLSRKQRSANVVVYRVSSRAPLAQRIGVGLKPAQQPSDPQRLLWASGRIQPLPDGGREVRIMIGLDVEAPATVRVEVTAVSPRRLHDAPDEGRTERKEIVQVSRTGSFCRVDLR